jgi:hypothetical protein
MVGAIGRHHLLAARRPVGRQSGTLSGRHQQVEILTAIHRNLASLDSGVYAAFLKDNAALWRTTKQRVVSYWNCYYRRTWWRRGDYVGFQIIEYLDSLLLRID